MKKFLLASFVVISFGLYSFHQRHGDSAAVVAPSSPNQNTTSVTPTSTAPSTTSTSQPVAATGFKDGQYTGNAAEVSG